MIGSLTTQESLSPDITTRSLFSVTFLKILLVEIFVACKFLVNVSLHTSKNSWKSSNLVWPTNDDALIAIVFKLAARFFF